MAWYRLSDDAHPGERQRGQFGLHQEEDLEAVNVLLAAEGGPLALTEQHCEHLGELLAESRCVASPFALAKLLAGCSATTDAVRDKIFASERLERHMFAGVRAIFIEHPATSLVYVRRALTDGGSPTLWSVASKRPDAVTDPECRQLLARSGNPHVVLALTKSAPVEERAQWLARLAAHPLVASRAFARGDFEGWEIPENLATALMTSEREDVRARAFLALGTAAIGPEAEAARRPAGRQYGPRTR